MLAQGNASKPVPLSDATAGSSGYFPERWLATGEPYEFTTTGPTTTQEAPSQDLLDEFRALTGSMAPVLGLGIAATGGASSLVLERTEGRANITEPLATLDGLEDYTETAWGLPDGDVQQVKMVCVIVCDSRVNRSGKAWHKDSQSHFKVSE